jgi:hypothetical protein
MAEKKNHRGRFQAQGGGLEESEAWGQDEPLTKDDGLSLLARLKNSLSPRERRRREKAFEKAERFIQNANGVDAVKKKSFFGDDEDRSIRVDIEILGGKAFVCLVIFIILLVACLRI